MLFAWYRALDRLLPAGAKPCAAVVAKKILLDATVLAIPYYSAFYVGMDFMEVRGHLPLSFLHLASEFTCLWLLGTGLELKNGYWVV